MYLGHYIKYPLFLSDVNETFILWTDFRKVIKYEISWKSAHWQPSFSTGTDRQADMTQIIVALRNFTNAPKVKESLGFACKARASTAVSRWRRVMAGLREERLSIRNTSISQCAIWNRKEFPIEMCPQNCWFD